MDKKTDKILVDRSRQMKKIQLKKKINFTKKKERHFSKITVIK